MERPLALVVDKDPAVRALIRDVFEEQNIIVLGAGSDAETVELFKSRSIDILIVDTNTPGVNPLEMLRRSLEWQQAPIVVGVSGAEEGATGRTDLIRAGAFEVLTKPLAEDALQQAVARLLRQRDVLSDLRRLREELRSREGYNGLVGRTAAMERIREQLRRLSATDAPVLFTGEPGAGKELAARTLHEWSSEGSDHTFVVVDCCAVADGQREAPWRSSADTAASGALFLEGITDLSLDLQEKLAAGLAGQGRAYRLFSSFVGDPRGALEDGRLLQDLHQQIAGETVALPPLRERKGDIALLARHFISAIREINNLPPIQIAPATLALLESYRWPDNVQELRTAMEQAVILSPDGVILPEHLPDRIREFPGGGEGPAAPAATSRRRFRAAKREIVEAFERRYLKDLMERHGGNVTAASQQAGMLRSALQRLLRKYDLKSAEFRTRGSGDATQPRSE